MGHELWSKTIRLLVVFGKVHRLRYFIVFLNNLLSRRVATPPAHLLLGRFIPHGSPPLSHPAARARRCRRPRRLLLLLHVLGNHVVLRPLDVRIVVVQRRDCAVVFRRLVPLSNEPLLVIALGARWDLRRRWFMLPTF